MNEILKIGIGAGMIGMGYWAATGTPPQIVAVVGGALVALTGAVLAVASARNLRDLSNTRQP